LAVNLNESGQNSNSTTQYSYLTAYIDESVTPPLLILFGSKSTNTNSHASFSNPSKVYLAFDLCSNISVIKHLYQYFLISQTVNYQYQANILNTMALVPLEWMPGV
jgi:hypothetical protein